MLKKIAPALFLLLLAGCNPTPPPSVPVEELAEKGEFDYGHLEHNKYVNDFFKFEIQIPEGWAIQNKEQMKNLAKMGQKMVSGDDENMAAAVKASQINSANLLVAYQHELGSMVETNPNIMVVAENVKNFPGIKTGQEYLFQAKKMLERSQVKYTFQEISESPVSYDGKDFYEMAATLEVGGQSVTQKFYSTILNGFSFNIITTYFNEDEAENLQEILKTMRFKGKR